MRILLVEDSPRLQRSIGAGLRKSGYAVDVSGDGEDGLWRALSDDYDVIVLDLMLPKLDGLAEASGSEAKLLVSNDADSLRPENIPFLFEPFWRKDPARTDSSHSGLGLALVAAYADVLRGRVEAKLDPDGKLRILLALPYDSQVGRQIQAQPGLRSAP